MVCTFFGHKDCDPDPQLLMDTIEGLINEGYMGFYVGREGNFDKTVHWCLRMLRPVYPEIYFGVVLAYPPWERDPGMNLEDAMYPPIEGHPKTAIQRRNTWMLRSADACICYIDHTWGGAYKTVMRAKRRGLRIINLGTAKL